MYGLKKFTPDDVQVWWRVHIIRVRQFGRKLVESVLESSAITHVNKSSIETVPSDLFLMQGDYLLIECEDHPQASCRFLIYYTYKPRTSTIDSQCETNEYPDLFKLVLLHYCGRC